jgi:hypothetical protein
VLAQSPQASLIGEAGDCASCSAVFIKRRSRRLSERSTPSADHLVVYADRLSQLRVISTNPAQSGNDENEKRLEERLLTI